MNLKLFIKWVVLFVIIFIFYIKFSPKVSAHIYQSNNITFKSEKLRLLLLKISIELLHVCPHWYSMYQPPASINAHTLGSMLQSVDQESLQCSTNLRLSCSQDLSNYIRAIMKVDIVGGARFWHVARGLPEHGRLSTIPRSSKGSRKSETVRRGRCNSRPIISTCDIGLLPPSILSLSQSYNYFRDTDIVAWSCAILNDDAWVFQVGRRKRMIINYKSIFFSEKTDILYIYYILFI